MNVYSLIVFVHVLAAVVLLGGSLFAPLVRAAIRGATTAEQLRLWVAFDLRAARANPLAAAAMLGTGIYLASQGWWDAPWVLLAVATFLINSIWAARTVHQFAGRLARTAAAAQGPVTPEMDRLRRSAHWETAGRVLLANDLATLYLMIVRPEWTGSAAAVVLANVALLAPRVPWRDLSPRSRARAGA